MSRFIDMDKLVLPKSTVDKIQKKGIPAILDWLWEQKSIEIVCCKDCKYGEYREDYDDYECMYTGLAIVNHGDFYCADGERKETLC